MSFSSNDFGDSENAETWASPANVRAVRAMMLERIPAEWWQAVRCIMEFETGMELGPARQSRLHDAIASLGLSTVPTIQQLMDDHQVRAWFVEHVAAALTIGESFFLRNENHMQALREIVLPQIVLENAGRQSVRLWSAGCATGEEPYSLAILISQLLEKKPGWHVSILGTDLNPEFLERARAARYRQWSFRQTTINQDHRYFSVSNRIYQVHEDLRKLVRFQYLNLVKDAYPSPLNGTIGLDLILFRNVAIYLKSEVTNAILQRLYRALRPGGWLLLGETEVTLAKTLGFEIHHFLNSTVFRKPLDSSHEYEYAMPKLAEQTPARPVLPLSSVVPLLPEWVPLPMAPATDPAFSQNTAVSDEVAFDQIPVLKKRLKECDHDHERAPLRQRLVHLLLEHSQLDEAWQELVICLRENPLSIECHLLQAGLAEDLGNLAQAEQTYRRALYLDRNCAVAHFHLGLIQQQRGDAKGAERSFRTVRELSARREVMDLVEYGDGVCYGRLLDMVQMFLDAGVN